MAKHHKVDLLQSANIAWHIRVNGLDNLPESNIRQMAATIERLLERDRQIQKLLAAVESSNSVSSKTIELKKLVEEIRLADNVTS